jgi:lipopolysaccharide export system protein LptA
MRTKLMTTALVALLLVTGALVYAQTTTRFENATIEADLLKFDFHEHTFDFTGDVTADIDLSGARVASARIIAEQLAGELSAANEVLTLTAGGPLEMTLQLVPDVDGNRQRVEVEARDEIEYSRSASEIVIRGEAVADFITTSTNGDDFPPVTLRGEVITYNTETGLASVEQPFFSVGEETATESSPAEGECAGAANSPE